MNDELIEIVDERNEMSHQDSYTGEDEITPESPEVKYCEKKWGDTGMIEGLSGKKRKFVAVMLENQRLYNEIGLYDDSRFKRVSIPMVRRIFSGTMLDKLVSVQPMIGPASLVYYTKEAEEKVQIQSETVVSRTRKLKAILNCEAQQDLRKQHNLDAEAEWCSIIAQEVIMEIEQEVLTDLRNDCAFKKTINFNYLAGDKYEAIRNLITTNATEQTKLMGGKYPNWMIMHPKTAKVLYRETAPQYNNFKTNYYSDIDTGLGSITVYTNLLCPQGNILMGYCGESYLDAGYVYAPYVALQPTPVTFDPVNLVSTRGILCRYGKVMLNDAYYSTLTIENLKEEQCQESML